MILNQCNPEYKNLLLAPSKLSFNDFGCTTCAIKTGIEKITNKILTLKEVMDCIVYNKDGLIVWKACNWKKLGVRFVWRFYRKPNLTDFPVMLSDDYFSVLQINNFSHWVLWVNGGKVTTVSDSWAKTEKAKYGYTHTINNNKINGFALFCKI